jgi:hypothetical protein
MKTTILAAPAVLLILAASSCASQGGSTATAAKHSAAGAAAAAPQNTTPAAAPSPVTSALATPPPSPSPTQAPQVTARFNGSGTENTQPFTVPDSWHLSWAYWACDSGTGNFIVNEDNTDGSADFNGISVNELGAGRGPVATYAYGDAGTHYFSVDSECSWSLAVVIGGP